ncbi:Dut dUTPase [uncultured Caudovirales phage]|uniref:dUTP diphosphatase n=1 Tax=uncultured Caudovirales phage TaxID=2100421 RepID=A0A6J5NRI4_9CAUD|nr:Dut dUTPase [uncultured Caudovirales phage]
MQVRVKKLHEDAVIPAYGKPGDAGLDLTATSIEKDSYGNVVYGTGLAIEIPEGYVGLIFPRSSNSKTDLYLTNHVGVVDSGYRGEIMFKFRANPSLINAVIYQVGDRVGQLIIIPYPQIKLVEATELSDSERGEGGFGSTGK